MWSSFIGAFSSSGGAGGWTNVVQSFTGSGNSGWLSQLPNLLSNFNGSQSATNSGNNNGNLLSFLPSIMESTTGSKDILQIKDNDGKENKFLKALNIALKTPGQGQETKTGETMSKVGRPIGSLIGNIWGPIGSLAGGDIGEDAFGKIGDTFKALF